jgi:hypothetical protein
VTFRIYRGLDANNLSPVEDVSGAERDNVIPGNPEGTTFYYKVTALNSVGESPLALSNPAFATTFPAAPSALVAKPTEVNKIELTWTNQSAKADKFRIHDFVSGNDDTVTKTNPQPPLEPTGVAEGSKHEYRIYAVVSNGFQNSASAAVESEPFPPTSALALAAKPLAFKFQLPAPGTDQNIEGFCLVQKIPKALLKNGGTTVKITVRGSPAGNLKINSVWISRVAPSPPADNPYDPAGDRKEVAVNVTAPANTNLPLPAVQYTIPNPPEDLLIAFDIGTSVAGNEGNVRYYTLSGATAYAKGNAQEAGATNRTPPYGEALNTLYLVETIEVT